MTPQQQLDELKLKQVIAAGAVAAAALTGGSTDQAPKAPQAASAPAKPTFKDFAAKQEARAVALADVITDKYDVDDALALKIAKLAIKYEKPTFPKAEDILSVIGVESSFNPHATSKLKHDPAVGLLQVRPHVWGLNPHRLKTDMEEQIKTGSEILHKYYQKLKSKQATLQAFNVGLTNYMKKKGLNPRYVPKFDAEREMYEGKSETHRQIVLRVQQELLDQGWDDVVIKFYELNRYVLRMTAGKHEYLMHGDVEKEGAGCKIVWDDPTDPIGNFTDEGLLMLTAGVLKRFKS